MTLLVIGGKEGIFIAVMDDICNNIKWKMTKEVLYDNIAVNAKYTIIALHQAYASDNINIPVRVQSKAAQIDWIVIAEKPDYLIVLRIFIDGMWYDTAVKPSNYFQR